MVQGPRSACGFVYLFISLLFPCNSIIPPLPFPFFFFSFFLSRHQPETHWKPRSSVLNDCIRYCSNPWLLWTPNLKRNSLLSWAEESFKHWTFPQHLDAIRTIFFPPESNTVSTSFIFTGMKKLLPIISWQDRYSPMLLRAEKWRHNMWRYETERRMRGKMLLKLYLSDRRILSCEITAQEYGKKLQLTKAISMFLKHQLKHFYKEKKCS